MAPQAAPLLLDACVAINLMATGRPLTDFVGHGDPLWLGKRAAAEVMYLEPTEPGGERELVSLASAAYEGQITIVELAPSELAPFVEFARVVDDGEAEALAVAVVRGAVLATDDRKACRVAYENEIQVAVTSTSAIIRRWASREPRPSADELATTLRAIEQRASFVPPRHDPNRGWWIAYAGHT